MTNKEASNILKENIEELLKNPQVILDDLLVEATNIAIKVLEREDDDDIFICRKVSAGDLL